MLDVISTLFAISDFDDAAKDGIKNKKVTLEMKDSY